MLPKLKIYEVDYSFIIKNYLNPEMWKKTWVLYEYKDYVFNLNISHIDTENNKIVFKLKSNKLGYYSYEYIEYRSENMKIDLLKNMINGSIFRLMERIEEAEIESTSEYKYISNSRYEEQEFLTQVASDFLDDNNVTNDDIREVYIENYVSNHSTIGDKLADLKSAMQYQLLTDLFLVFVKSIKDETRIKVIENKIDHLSNKDEILKQVEEYMQYLETDEAKDEAQDNLEAI